jgi:hypothetical protein
MKSISLRMIPASLVFVPFLAGCGAEPITGDTTTNPVVSVRSDLEAKAYGTDGDGFHSSTAAGMTVDSLEVTSAYVVANDLMLRGKDEHAIEERSMLRANQFLLVFEPAGPYYVSDVEVLAGTYPKVEYEVRPLHGSLDSLLTIDSRCSAFVTFGATNSVIIQGHTYKNGVKLPFVFTSVTAIDEGQSMFDQPIVLESGMRDELRVRFLSQTAFGARGAVLDPRDERNRPAIESQLRSSIGVFRL